MKIFENISPKGASAFLLMGGAISFFVLLLYLISPEFLSVIDMKSRDLMFKKRGVETPPSEVIIVAVDEKSVNELGRWPWSRTTIATLVESLAPAKVVAFDMVFSESESVEADRALSKAISESGNVVLGYFFRNDSTEVPDAISLDQHSRSTLSLRYHSGVDSLEGAGSPIYKFKGIEPNINLIGKGASGFGSFNILPSKDGVYRSANMFYQYNDLIYPSLSIEAIKNYIDDDPLISVDEFGIEGFSFGNVSLPLDELGRITLNFYGPGGTFKTISAVDIIKGRVAVSEYKDKMVFIGATEKAIYDIRVTPVDPLYPGVEVHATIAGSFLENRFLIQDAGSFLLDIIFILLFPLILAFFIAKTHKPYISLIVYISFIIAIISGTFYAFSDLQLVLGVIYPILAISITYIGLETYRNVVVENKSKYLKKAFSTYVSSQVVSEIIKDPDSLKLGGEKKEISVLFSDIRSFTTLAESMPPEDLVKLLNEYLSPMTEIVFKEEGTLDKYIGDAIMAIFNAPFDLPNHPVRACNCALHMIAKMPPLNDLWDKRAIGEVSIGIGINTGEAIVGNMGAKQRFDYTAIGDTVNLSSRLEGTNKIYGTNIIVSESTFKAVGGKLVDCQFIFRELDIIKVKGKNKPVSIFELLDFKSNENKYKGLNNMFARARVDYRKGKFKTAIKGFEEALTLFPNDNPSKLYIKRCNEYIATAPDKNWDGVYIATSK